VLAWFMLSSSVVSCVSHKPVLYASKPINNDHTTLHVKGWILDFCCPWRNSSWEPPTGMPNTGGGRL